jgi:hypothetical protein
MKKSVELWGPEGVYARNEHYVLPQGLQVFLFLCTSVCIFAEEAHKEDGVLAQGLRVFGFFFLDAFGFFAHTYVYMKNKIGGAKGAWCSHGV